MYAIIPTRENKARICELLGIQDYCQITADFDDEDTADMSLADALQDVDPQLRKQILYQLIKCRNGVGQAGHTIQGKTLPEVVGLTGHTRGTINNKSSILQNDQPSGNINGSRSKGATTHIFPASNVQSCAPNELR